MKFSAEYYDDAFEVARVDEGLVHPNASLNPLKRLARQCMEKAKLPGAWQESAAVRVQNASDEDEDEDMDAVEDLVDDSDTDREDEDEMTEWNSNPYALTEEEYQLRLKQLKHSEDEAWERARQILAEVRAQYKDTPDAEGISEDEDADETDADSDIEYEHEQLDDSVSEADYFFGETQMDKEFDMLLTVMRPFPHPKKLALALKGLSQVRDPFSLRRLPGHIRRRHANMSPPHISCMPFPYAVLSDYTVWPDGVCPAFRLGIP
ncbi:hypothetical protein DACRYDRAFT_105501 [Dacryopinax primogenitus]|uniref:Uncharacterized protein n=1 Tax=Dacryopinax primogenitus (strain DJM 731) TaxID=1858805 RepID=M5G2J2_DACPD|nr:uncharacterized protein DACRYDRAFT_105501 [Dacryopinax primogenitus]EJU04441.1 hypothetical protein DACRYDRAFT_105501 [Dacryopinax primogenitus]